MRGLGRKIGFLRKAGFLLLLVMGAAIQAAVPAADRQILNGTAAKIGNQVVTVRDARFFLALQRFRDGKKEPLAPEQPGELRSAVQRLLLEEMVFSELKSLKFEGGQRAVAEKDIASHKKGGRDRAWQQILKTYGKSDAAAVDRVWKSLQVEKFIQRRVETMAPIVTQAEVDRFIRDKASREDKRPDDKEVERLRPAATLELKKELMRKELEEWIVLLKRKYAVTNYLEG